ncbi:MAG: cytochrome o ubiquinol oxidase subunit IV [Pseudomonadota bacterium]
MSANTDSHDAHGSYRSYIVGFLASVVLTVIPFWLVMSETKLSLGLALTVIFGLGAMQILVHVYYFLHVDLKAEQGWQAMSLVFTAIILVIVLAGSIWVMFHLHENMMPAHEQIERVRELP